MPQYGIKPSRRWTRALGVFLAIGVAIGSIALLLVTQEPKKAMSSPVPAKAAVVPQIAEAKSEAEILFRGKSFSMLKRHVNIPYAAEITKINVVAGQFVEKDYELAEFKLDRQSTMHIQKMLYPETVLGLKRNQSDRKIGIEKLREGTLPIKKLQLERLEKEISNLKELSSKGMAFDEALKNKDRQIQAAKKEVFEITETIRQQELDLAKTNEDLKFYEERRRRDLELLEWQMGRSYSDSTIPINVGYLKATIPGTIIWQAPELHVKAELPAGFHAMMLSPLNQMGIRCKVHELDIVRLRLGERGSAVFDAIPDKTFSCTISRIPWVSRNPALEVPADYDLECELQVPDGRIKDGLTCNVKVTVTQ